MKDAVLQALKVIEQALKFQEGGVELVALNEETGEVRVRLTGTCDGCGLADVTLKEGIEAALVRAVPGVRSVIKVN